MRRSAFSFVLVAMTAACVQDATAPTPVFEPWLAFSPAPCTFTTVGTTMRLDADCSTSTTIMIPDGFTLDGGHHTITAVDPGVGSPFQGGVLRNAGTTAHVVFVDVRAQGLAVSCKAGNARLRGILFDGASGSIMHSSVIGVHQAGSGCQEGNAVEVRNFDGAPTAVVEIAHNTIDAYQKTGIVCNGDAICDIHHNDVGASATQAALAANAVQFGFGATGNLSLNRIAGNSWCQPSDWAATAVLLYDTGPGLVVQSNRIAGNSDVGIYAFSDGATIAKNFVSDVGPDCNAFGYDYGIGDWGTSYPSASNSLTKNQVSGFDTPYDPASPGGKNKVKKAHPAP